MLCRRLISREPEKAAFERGQATYLQAHRDHGNPRMTALFFVLVLVGVFVASSDSTGPHHAATARARPRKLNGGASRRAKGASTSPPSVDEILRALREEECTDAEKRLQGRRAALILKGGALEALKLFALSLVDPLCRGRLSPDDIRFGSSQSALGSLGRYVRLEYCLLWTPLIAVAVCLLFSNFGGLGGGGAAGSMCGPNGCF